MATYAAYRHVELDNVGYGKKRVLKPPGGGTSDIFGAGDEMAPRRGNKQNQSTFFEAAAPEMLTPRATKPEGNPVTGTGYTLNSVTDGPFPSAASSANGTSGASSPSSSSSTSSSSRARNRVPPGGFSSGLW